jgi:hypothetical protein
MQERYTFCYHPLFKITEERERCLKVSVTKTAYVESCFAVQPVIIKQTLPQLSRFD